MKSSNTRISSFDSQYNLRYLSTTQSKILTADLDARLAGKPTPVVPVRDLLQALREGEANGCYDLWLTAYLEACATAGGKAPPDLESYLPWNLTAERRQEWSLNQEEKVASNTS